MDTNQLMVTIRCLAYNHEPYIRQCLDGIVMQKTHFRFEAIVHDDASTDSTASLIREYASKYPDIIKPVLETENQYSKHDGSLQKIMNRYMRGKYIAFCEGDDYWTDPYKLQKQVDFLETHPEYGMVYTYARIYVQKNKAYSNRLIGKSVDGPEELLRHNCIPTLTTCLKSNLLFDFFCDVPFNSSWKMGDYPLWLYISMKKKIKFIPEQTAVYRIQESSASHSSSFSHLQAFMESTLSIKSYFLNLYGKKELKESIFQDDLYSIFILCKKFDKEFDLKKYQSELGIFTISKKLKRIMFLCKIPIVKDIVKKRWKKK